MAAANSLRTLMRPAIPSAPRIHPVMLAAFAPFSTSSSFAAAPPPTIKSRRDLPKKVKRSYKKKSAIVATKKPNPGERKAYRKRIQLSNNSAVPVQGYDALDAKTMSIAENVGKVVSLPNALVDQLRALEAFKTTQTWNLFRSPHVLLRQETIDIIAELEGAAKNKNASKLVLTGSRLSGKSLALLQAMSHAMLNGWVAIHIPEAQDLTNGNTEFSPVSDKAPYQFAQPVYTLKLLQNIYKANKTVLEGLLVQNESSLNANVKKGASLADLILSAKESDLAWPTLKILWAELTLPGRPPVLLSLDGLSHINMMSEYRDPAFNQVHSHDLTLVNMFVNALSGETKLPNGGAIIAATSGNNNHLHRSQELVLSQLEAGQAGREVPQPNPYERKYDQRVYDALKDTRIMRIEGLSQDETRSLMEYWGASGFFRSVLSSERIAEKWSLAGHGNVGELERSSLMTMRM